jgi:hypothetical protein
MLPRPARAALALAIAATLALGVVCLDGALRARVHFAGFLTYQSGAVASFFRSGWADLGEQGPALRVRDVIVSVDGMPTAGGPALA